MTFTNRVTTITQDVILPSNVDNFLTDNFLTFRMLGNGQPWEGTVINQPIKIAKNMQGRSFSGMDAHNTGTVETRQSLQYDLRAYNIPVAIPGLDKVVNKGEAAILNLVKQEMASTFMDALDDVATMLYADGTGNTSKDFLGLDALADDGTSAATIGGLSRTTFPTLAGTRTGSGGTMTALQVSTLLSTIAGGNAVKQRPTILLGTESVWDLCEKLFINGIVQANYDANGFPMVTRRSRGIMNQASLKGASGFTAIVYRGIPVIADEKATAQTLWALNENYIQWYGAQSPDLKSISLGSDIDSAYNEAPTEDSGVQWSGWKDSYNQFGEVAYLYILGNLTTSQPRRQGRLTGITTA
jgi:hypothetical protein